MYKMCIPSSCLDTEQCERVSGQGTRNKDIIVGGQDESPGSIRHSDNTRSRATAAAVMDRGDRHSRTLSPQICVAPG